MQSSLLAPDLTRDPQPGDTLILWLPIFLAVGIGLYFALSFEPNPWALRGGVIGALSLAGITWRWRMMPIWRWGAAFLVAVTLGAFLAQARTQSLDTKLLTDRVWNATVSGTIIQTERAATGWRIIIETSQSSFPQKRESSQNPDSAPLDPRVHGDDKAEKLRLRLSLRTKGVTPEIGDAITVKASLMPPSPPLVLGMYDFQRHAYFKGLGGYGYITRVLAHEKAQSDDRQNALERYREFIGDAVYRKLPQPEAGVTAALLNGQRAGIARKTTENLVASGLQHIISISGVHVSMMAGVVFFMLRFAMACSMTLALKFPIKKIAAACAMVSIIVYMLIVGRDPATFRAVVMTSVVLLAVMVDREAINLRIVAIAAIVLLLWEPENLLHIGFQLSFMAVTALVYFYQVSKKFWYQPFWQDYFLMRGLRALAMAVVTTVIVTAATAPLVFVHFQQVPLLSVLANLLVTPVMGLVIMPATFFVYLFSPVPFLLDWAIVLMGWGVTAMLEISRFVTGLPHAVLRVPAIPMSLGTVFTLSALAVMIVKGRGRYAGYGMMLAVCVAIFFHRPPDLFLAHGRLIVLPERATGTLYIEGKADRFTRELFLKATGTKHIKPFDGPDDILMARHNNKTIRIIRDVPSLDMACDEQADVIVTRYYLDAPCPGSVVVDRHFLEDRGGAAIWLDNDIPRVTSVYTGAARRPWQQQSRFGGWFSRKDGAKLDKSKRIDR